MLHRSSCEDSGLVGQLVLLVKLERLGSRGKGVGEVRNWPLQLLQSGQEGLSLSSQLSPTIGQLVTQCLDQYLGYNVGGEREFGSQNDLIIYLKCLKWFSGQKEANYLSKMCQVVS